MRRKLLKPDEIEIIIGRLDKGYPMVTAANMAGAPLEMVYATKDADSGFARRVRQACGKGQERWVEMLDKAGDGGNASAIIAALKLFYPKDWGFDWPEGAIKAVQELGIALGDTQPEAF